MLSPAELKLLHPRKRLSAFRPPAPSQLQPDDGDADSSGGNSSGSGSRSKVASATYFWSGLVRLDVLAAPTTTSLAFYGPKSMVVSSLPLLKVRAGARDVGALPGVGGCRSRGARLAMPRVPRGGSGGWGGELRVGQRSSCAVRRRVNVWWCLRGR